MNCTNDDTDTKYKAYHVQAFMEQCGCGKNYTRLWLSWNSSCIVSQVTLENAFKACEGDVADILETFKIWYLLAGRYLEEPDDFPF
jgi:hypothetical protein